MIEFTTLQFLGLFLGVWFMGYSGGVASGIVFTLVALQHKKRKVLEDEDGIVLDNDGKPRFF